jgi:hypothetical protein
MIRLRVLLFSLLLLILLLPGSSASAHKPIWDEHDGVLTIPDLTTSYAFYRDLPAGKVDVYKFHGQAAQLFSAGMHIPDLAELQQYSVNVALFGPGLPEADHAQLPPEHPENLGALIFPSVVRADFFESFTQTNYLGRQSMSATLPADGDYYLLVWQPDGIAGKYVLDSGSIERFTPGDLFRFPLWWVQVHVFFGQGPLLIGVGGVILAAAVFYIYRRRKK